MLRDALFMSLPLQTHPPPASVSLWLLRIGSAAGGVRAQSGIPFLAGLWAVPTGTGETTGWPARHS